VDGEWYKSRGEVRIANAFFRRGVKVDYEQWFPESKSFPDFTVRDPSGSAALVIEFFGMVGDAGYDANKRQKLAFWKAHVGPARFLALYPDDVRSEDALAERLETELDAAGIAWRHLSDDEVWAQRRDGALRDFHTNVTRFIGRARKLRLSPGDVADLAERHAFISRAERLFVKLATDAFDGYLRRLATEGLDDFDGILERAIECVERGQTTFTREMADQRGDVGRLRLLQVDEMQDLSPLFGALIDATRAAAGPRLSVVGVGDDWQAINGFAGSDTKLFSEFRLRAPESSRLVMRSNYRSSQPVVGASNAIMSRHGEPGRATRDVEGEVIDVSDGKRKHLAMKEMDADVATLIGLIELALSIRRAGSLCCSGRTRRV
jgi:DNA helicase-4